MAASKLFLVFVVCVLVCTATATARNLAGSDGGSDNDEKTIIIPGGIGGYGGGLGGDGIIVEGGDGDINP
ncbi:hypothetical protein C2S52_005923 [Perilla frutescens var. hirtella]|nr:hypothetical protein C2S52_005923 [Perilla frutescens var. hirtella]